MEKGKKTTQQIISELPLDTPLNPEMNLVIEGTYQDFRNAEISKEEDVLDLD